MNTKFVLGLPRANQVGLEHAKKNLRRCERWLAEPPPPGYEHAHGFNVFKASALWADAFYKSKCPYVCLSVCLSVCLFTFEVLFNGLFAPTSQSWMSNIFRDLECKEVVSDLNIFVWKWSKIAGQK